MKRRNFICVALGVAAQAALAPAYLLAAPHEIADDADDWRFYEAFQERLRKLVVEQDLEFKMAWLAPPRDGFRRVTVFFKNGPSVEWSQPWGANAHSHSIRP